MPKSKKIPPKATGRKLPPLYEAQVGLERLCPSCGEAKIIDRETRNFAPSKAHRDSIAAVCRSCQGKAAQGRGTSTPQADAPVPAADTQLSAKWPNAKKNPKAYWARVEAQTDRLYALAAQSHASKELEEVKTDLNRVTRLRGDPAGGGEQTDPELAFRTFAAVVSHCISSWKPWGEIHDADIIPALVSDDDRVLILASRNSGKSTVTEIYAAWLLHRNPMDIIGVVSGAALRARRTLRTARQFISNVPLLKDLEPDDECLDSAFQFVTPQANGRLGSSVSFSSFGIATSMTGHRFNKCILDDVEVKRDRTPAMQETLDFLTSEIDNILNPGGRVVALGTPQVAGMSIYGRWASSGAWSVTRAKLFEELPPDEGKGTRTQLRSRWVSRWTDEELERKRRSLPAREFDLHWRLEFGSLEEDDRPLKLRAFITVDWPADKPNFPTVIYGGGDTLTHLETGVAEQGDTFQGPAFVSPDTTRYVATCAAVDPASGIVGRDEVGLCIVSVTTQGLGVIRCLTGVRGRNATEAMTKTAALIHQFLPTKIVCEARADSLYPAQLASVLGRRGYPALVEPVYSGSRKGERVLDAIGVPLADGRLVMLEDVVRGEDALETIKQVTHMTLDARHLRHDDRVDALAWALSAVAPMLTVDAADNMPTASQMKLEELLKLPLRKGGITEDSWEARLFESSEEEERLRMKLDHCLAQQEAELRQGIMDEGFARYIESLRRDLAKFRRHAAVG